MADYVLNLLFTATGADAIKDIVSGVAGEIGKLGDALVGSNAQFEQYNVAYTTLIKNSADFKAAHQGVTDTLKLTADASDQAKQHMQDLADFGARTPFELPGVVEADTVLQGFGLNSQEAAAKFGMAGKEILTVAGDVASGTGAQFKEISLLIGKFSTGATGEAISRMQELGITSRDELSKLGLEFSKAGQLMSPVPQAMETVLKLMKEKYGGLMEAQSATFNGMLSNLEDWKGQTLRQLGEPIFEALKPQLQGLLTFLGSDEAKQGIRSFAEGIAHGVQAVGQIASVIHDYGVPALSALATATAGYAMVTLPAAIPQIVTATTAFAAQAVAVAAAAAPIAAVAVAVAAVTKAFQDYNATVASATAQVLTSRQWWQDSAQALDDYGKASDSTKQKLSGLAQAVGDQRSLIENEINTLGRRMAAGTITEAQYQREMDIINQHRVALTASSQALNDQVQALEHQASAYDANAQAQRYYADASRGTADAVAATDKELKEAQKTLDQVAKQGPQALQAAAQTTNEFLAKQAEAQATHAQKLAELQKKYADATTKAAKDAVQQQIDAEQKGFQEQQQTASVAYAQQEAAQRAHLGQELIDYIQAQAVKNAAFREKADELTTSITKQFGVTESQSSQSFGHMLNDIDRWAQNGTQSADQVAQHLDDTAGAAANTQRTMDALAKKYTIELQEDLKNKKINADQYAQALRDIPKRIAVELHENANSARSEVEDYKRSLDRIPKRVTTEVHTSYTSSGQPASAGASAYDGGVAGHRAVGGPVDAMRAYIVGEDGPELFVPGADGAIIPNSSGGGGGGDLGGALGQIGQQAAEAAAAAAQSASDAIAQAMGQIGGQASGSSHTSVGRVRGRGHGAVTPADAAARMAVEFTESLAAGIEAGGQAQIHTALARVMADNIDGLKEYTKELTPIGEAARSALDEAYAESKQLAAVDMDKATEYYELRSRQIKELAELQKDLAKAATEAERQSVRDRIALVEEAQQAELAGYDALIKKAQFAASAVMQAFGAMAGANGQGWTVGQVGATAPPRDPTNSNGELYSPIGPRGTPIYRQRDAGGPHGTAGGIPSGAQFHPGSIVIHAAAGQSADHIADAVIRKIQQRTGMYR